MCDKTAPSRKVRYRKPKPIVEKDWNVLGVSQNTATLSLNQMLFVVVDSKARDFLEHYFRGEGGTNEHFGELRGYQYIN